MPASTFQQTFEITSLTPPGLQLTVSYLSDIGASSNATLPPTVGQLWPRITQT